MISQTPSLIKTTTPTAATVCSYNSCDAPSPSLSGAAAGSSPRHGSMFAHHEGAALIRTARRESLPAFQSHATVHTRQLPWHSPVPPVHRLSFAHHHPTFSAKMSCGQEHGIRPSGADESEDWDYPTEPCSCRAPRAKNPVALFGNRIGPGPPGLSLVTHKTNNPYLQDERSAARSGADPST